MYKRLSELHKTPIKPKYNKNDDQPSMTIPNQAMSLKDIVQRSISGFPVPMQREEIILPDNINNILEGNTYDIVSDAKFRKMSKVERQRYIDNIRGLKQGFQEKIDKAIQEKQQADAQQTTAEATPSAAPST